MNGWQVMIELGARSYQYLGAQVRLCLDIVSQTY
jgi:hypothetical protein